MLSFEWNFLGLSSETKPATGEKVIDGSTYYECDTGNFYIYYKNNWYKQTFVTEDGINVYVYKFLMRKMFKKMYDTNISKAHIINPATGSEIEFTTELPSSITDLTGYGDTTQQTYSGKNLYGMDQETTVGAHITWTKTGNTANGTGTSSGTWGYIQSVNSTFTNNLSVGTYTMSIAEALPSPLRLQLHCIKSDNSAVNYTMLADATSLTFTTTDVITAANIAVTALTSGETYDITIKDFQLEAGSTPTSFEPYVGGVPAPNPDYPQAVNVVTGTQTVKINDESFSVTLGTTELGKIGTYQDYIYKSGDDWYLHKEVGKVIFDGSENWSRQLVSNSLRYFFIDVADALIITNTSALTPVVSDYYSSATPADIYSGLIKYGISLNSNIARLRVRNEDCTNLTDFTTWLTTHNTTVYYALATSTDTKITDATLLAELDAIFAYTIPTGNNTITVTADGLPLLLKLTITERE